MKAVMISIRPKWIAKIASGEKTVEVRKTVPKCRTPFKVYIYATETGERIFTKGDRVFEIARNLTGKVVGEFVCDNIRPFEVQSPAYWYLMNKAILEQACLTKEELHDYIGAGHLAYGLHISELKIYDKPKELSEFQKSENKKCDHFYYDGLCGLNCFFHCSNMDCERKAITRPPQSWCYVEELK